MRLGLGTLGLRQVRVRAIGLDLACNYEARTMEGKHVTC